MSLSRQCTINVKIGKRRIDVNLTSTHIGGIGKLGNLSAPFLLSLGGLGKLGNFPLKKELAQTNSLNWVAVTTYNECVENSEPYSEKETCTRSAKSVIILIHPDLGQIGLNLTPGLRRDKVNSRKPLPHNDLTPISPEILVREFAIPLYTKSQISVPAPKTRMRPQKKLTHPPPEG